MPLTFNWLDSSNLNGSLPSQAQSFSLARIGTSLFAGVEKVADNLLRFYRSNDAGVTWTPSASPNTSTYSGSLMLHARPKPDDADKIHIVDAQPGGTSGIAFFDYSFGSDAWGSPTYPGGGDDGNSHGIPTTDSPGLLDFQRGDGTRIVVKQDGYSYPGAIRILKESGGTWTILSTIGGVISSPGRQVMTGYMHNDVVYIVGYKIDFDTTGDSDLILITVSSADVVSSEQTIKSQVEISFNAPSAFHSRMDISADGNTIGLIFPHRAYSGYSSGLGETHAALLDISSTPLSPSITTEKVANYDSKFQNGNATALGASFKGGNTLNAYWLEEPSAGSINLYESTRTAVNTWSARTALFADQGDGSWGATYGSLLSGFDLLNEFTDGVGILICQFNWDNGLSWVGYNGPAMPPPATFSLLGGNPGGTLALGNYLA